MYTYVSILTRSGDRVQRGATPRIVKTVRVSILTRSGDRVQQGAARHGARQPEFQSSPGPETGCNSPRSSDSSGASKFQSSPGPETGCNPQQPGSPRRCTRFNPHPVRRPGATLGDWDRTGLTVVSILTRSGDRVQRRLRPHRRALIRFQSSPGPETGCNVVSSCCRPHQCRCFNPHPVRRPGATLEVPAVLRHRHVSILTRSGDRVQPLESQVRPRGIHSFNPHPVRRPGATIGSLDTSSCCFNPHPVRRPGATGHAMRLSQPRRVSILTRSGDRVQRRRHKLGDGHDCVSILTRSGDRVQRRRHPNRYGYLAFQSSPGPETGCNGGPGRRPRVVCRIWGCFGPRRGAFARKTAAVALHTRAKPPILPRTFPKTGQHRRFARSHD